MTFGERLGESKIRNNQIGKKITFCGGKNKHKLSTPVHSRSSNQACRMVCPGTRWGVARSSKTIVIITRRSNPSELGRPRWRLERQKFWGEQKWNLPFKPVCYSENRFLLEARRGKLSRNLKAVVLCQKMIEIRVKRMQMVLRLRSHLKKNRESLQT